MKSPTKKTMRVATAFTGAIAGAIGGVAAFAPAAHADTAVPYPYKIWVKLSDYVGFVQVCGYKDVGGGDWTCTAVQNNPDYYKQSYAAYMGSNWKDGKVNVWVWGSISGANEHGDTCNTNGAYYGTLRTGGVSLKSVDGGGFGLFDTTC